MQFALNVAENYYQTPQLQVSTDVYTAKWPSEYSGQCPKPTQKTETMSNVYPEPQVVQCEECFSGNPDVPQPPLIVHTPLWYKVDLFTYPAEMKPIHTTVPKEHLIRLFFGQLPYGISNGELNYALGMVTDGACSVHFIERIIKKGKPTGCVHAYCTREELGRILDVAQTILFDECGFWVPRSQYQVEQLAAYCTYLMQNREGRPPSVPYQTMTIENAKSSFVPPPRGHPMQQHLGGEMRYNGPMFYSNNEKVLDWMKNLSEPEAF